jgi:hypothetical protein
MNFNLFVTVIELKIDLDVYLTEVLCNAYQFLIECGPSEGI